MHVATTITYETAEMVNAFKTEVSNYVDLCTIGHTNLSHVLPNLEMLPEKYKSILLELKDAETINKQRTQCNEVFGKLSINWNGDITCCCADYDDFLLIGKLDYPSGVNLKSIWENSKKLKIYQDMLKNHLFDELHLCKHCFDTMELRKQI